jgi:hypothetical protein
MMPQNQNRIRAHIDESGHFTVAEPLNLFDADLVTIYASPDRNMTVDELRAVNARRRIHVADLCAAHSYVRVVRDDDFLKMIERGVLLVDANDGVAS